MIASTRARVSSRRNGERLITRETVFFDTPDSRAMSLMVRRFLRPRSASSLVLLVTPFRLR